MATTPSGWLKPRDLSAQAVARRALGLLGALIDDDQREQAERHGGFAVPLADKVFWIPLTGTPWCAFADDGRVEHYCIAPDKHGGMPDGDVATTYVLWISADHEGFLREANVLSTKRIDWPDSESDLVRILAELAAPAPPPRRKPKKRKRRRAITHLSEDAIRAMFLRHGRTAPEEVLVVLTKS